MPLKNGNARDMLIGDGTILSILVPHLRAMFVLCYIFVFDYVQFDAVYTILIENELLRVSI